MSYMDNIEQDLARAKEILRDGKLQIDELRGIHPNEVLDQLVESSGTIYGKDRFVAYKLLESFVAEIERLQVLVQDSQPMSGV